MENCRDYTWGPDRVSTVVFVTAHDQFALRAFETYALDYLVKPLNVERFEAAFGRVRERLRLTRVDDLAHRLTSLLAPERAEQQKKGIKVRGRSKMPNRRLIWNMLVQTYSGSRRTRFLEDGELEIPSAIVFNQPKHSSITAASTFN